MLKKIKKTWGKLTEGWLGYVTYALLGILFAFIVYHSLGYGLHTDMPVVAVYGNSMEHDSSVETDHYQWLEKNLNYSRNQINSWPYSNGLSMGDMPIVRGEDKYKVGDVVVYFAEGQRAPIIHRIIKINDDGTYTIKGDNNPTPDRGTVKKAQIKGKVIFIIPKLGYFKIFVSKIFGVY